MTAAAQIRFDAGEQLHQRACEDVCEDEVVGRLKHGVDGFTLAGARVADLFAGTGALGLEAISRGAAFCLFVEDNAESRALIRRNVESFGLTGVTRIFRRDATDLGPAGTLGRFDLAFLDPPYGKGLADKALVSLVAGQWLAKGAVVVIEERAGTPVALPAGIAAVDSRTWGDTAVTIARLRA